MPQSTEPVARLQGIEFREETREGDWVCEGGPRHTNCKRKIERRLVSEWREDE